MSLTNRNVVIGAVALAVLGAGAVAFAMMSGGDHKAEMAAGGHGPGPGGRGAGGPPTQVEAFTVAPKVFTSRIEALGTLEPRERVVLTANAADRVTAIYFEDGQRVAKGKVLMTLVNEEESALLDAARATEANAKLVYERNQRLASGEAIAQLELERSKSSYEAALANVSSIQARLRDRVLTAPFSGVLGFRQVSVGAYVSPGQAVATLIDDSQMRLEFGVPSIYLTSLRAGLEIKATTKDFPGRVFVGKLTSIDNAVDPVTLAVKVRATLPNADGALKAGTSMSVELASQPRTSLSAPEISVIAEGSRNFVYVIDDSAGSATVRKVEVQLGTREPGLVEVLAGLQSGDRVVTDGVLKVRPGAPIRVAPAGAGAGGGSAIASGQGTTDKSGLAQ